MAMPRELSIVRHGFTDANKAQKLYKAGRTDEIPPEFYQRYDWQHPLLPEGEEQIRSAREWMLVNGMDPAGYDRRYASYFIRARQSAAILGGIACNWYLDNRIVERDWGLYGVVSPEERRALYSHTERARTENPWFVRYDNGESLAGSVLLKLRDFLDTQHREMAKKRVLVVAHGEVMWCFRALIEKMLPEEFQQLDLEKSETIRNGTILTYSHVNPYTDEVDYTRRWMRMIYPESPHESPNGGDWREVPMRREFSGAELLGQIAVYPPIMEFV